MHQCPTINPPASGFHVSWPVYSRYRARGSSWVYRRTEDMGVGIGSFNLLLAKSYSAREMSLSSETNGSSEPWPAVGTKEKSLKFSEIFFIYIHTYIHIHTYIYIHTYIHIYLYKAFDAISFVTSSILLGQMLYNLLYK